MDTNDLLNKQAKSCNYQEVCQLLNEELSLFRTIFQETSKFLDELDRFSVSRLLTLLHNRKEWIDELMLLENRRENLGADSDQNYKKEVSDILRSLVSIDARIFDLLKSRKQEIIKDLSKIADNRYRSRKNRSLNLGKSKVIDVLQE